MKARDKYQLGKDSNRRLDTVSHYLQLTTNMAMFCSPVDFGVPWMGGRRTAIDQQAVFAQGHSRCDGYENVSFHQALDDDGLGLAVDLVPYIKRRGFDYTAYGRFGIIGMLMLEAWEEFQDSGAIPKTLRLHWGGLWSHTSPSSLGWDMAHFEIRNTPQQEKL